MVLASAATAGTIPILVKFAYATGLTPLQTLAFRFGLASVGLAGLALAFGARRRRASAVRLLQLFTLGAAGYAGMAGAFFVALDSLPASLVELIAYVYPALVAIGAWLVFRRPITPRLALALLVSFAGFALLVGGVRFEAGLPLLLAVAAPVMYAGYILASEHLVREVPPLVASAVIHAGAATTFWAVLLVTGTATMPASAAGWASVVALAVLPSMIGISLLLAGLPRIGAAHASLLGTFEPIVTVVLAVVLLGERLTLVQTIGAAAVLAAVAVVSRRPPTTMTPLRP